MFFHLRMALRAGCTCVWSREFDWVLDLGDVAPTGDMFSPVSVTALARNRSILHFPVYSESEPFGYLLVTG
jgi:hypothetical protein